MRVALECRDVLAALAICHLLATAPIASAQPIADLPRIAIVEAGEPIENMTIDGHPYWHALLTAMRDLGLIEGETVAIDRWTAGDTTAVGLASLAQAVIAARPDIVIPRGLTTIDAFRKATATIPIIGLGTFPPDIDLAHPGANITGIEATAGVEIYMKQLQMLQAAAPAATAIAWVGPAPVWEGPIGEAVRQSARELGLELLLVVVDIPVTAETIRQSFDRLGDVEGLVVSPAIAMTPHHALVAELAGATRLPAIGLQRVYADAGLMMTYGPDLPYAYRRGAVYVARILGGAAPSELAIEQARKFDLVINLRTAAALGVTLPPGIMLMATDIIE